MNIDTHTTTSYASSEPNTETTAASRRARAPDWMRTCWRLIACLGLAALLLGAPKDARAQEATVTGTVTDAEAGGPLVGVNVRVAGTTTGTATGPDGTYRLAVDPGSITLRVTYTGFKAVTRTLSLEPDETTTVDVALESSLVNIDEVVVVGSRSASRSVLESPTAKDVISSEQLESAGTIETAQMIQKMVPGIDLPREAMGDGTETMRPIRFRGLGSDQVLVLINGKRRHTSAIETGGHSAGVDLNAIPSDAIKRVEVLRDGASAQYGSDAIAGVINVVLKDDAGTSFSAKSGIYSEGDGETVGLDLSHGFQIGDRGFLRLTGNAEYNGLVNRAGKDQRQPWWGTTVNQDADKGVDEGPFQDDVVNDGVDTTFFSPEQDRLNAQWSENPERTFKMGEPEKIEGGLFFNSEIPIESTGATAYTFGGATRRHAESGCFPRLPNSSKRFNVQFPNGTTPMYVNNTTDASAAVGLRGSGSTWTWDVSSQYGGNFFDRNMDDTHNATYQEFSPTYFNVGTKTSQQLTSNVDVTRTVETGLLESLNVSMGAEARFQNYQIGAGEPKSYLDGGQDIPTGPDKGGQPSVGSQCFPGFTPEDEVNTWRENVGAYVDVSTDVTENLLLTGALRFENYSDFGSTVTYKMAGRYEFLDGYAVRGSFNTGFKAPALLQSNFSSTQTGFQDLDDDGLQEGFEIRTFPLDSKAAQALGAPELDPETSVNVSGGVTAQPMENLSFTVDAYDIRVQDRISTTSTFFRSQNPKIDELFSEFPELDDLNAGTFFANAFDTRAYGVDVVAQYGASLGDYGQARLSASYNWRQREVTEVNETPGELSSRDAELCDRLCRLSFEEELPQSSLTATLNYRYEGFSLMLRGWRPGEQVNPMTNDLDGDGTKEEVVLDHVNRVPATFLMDAEVSYRFSHGLTLGVGGNNLFDTRPPETRRVTHQGTTFDSSFAGNWPYVNIFDNAFGTSGGFYYARINYEF